MSPDSDPLLLVWLHWFMILTSFVFFLVIVTLEPCERSETYVNGKRVAHPVQLRSGEAQRKGLRSSALYTWLL